MYTGMINSAATAKHVLTLHRTGSTKNLAREEVTSLCKAMLTVGVQSTHNEADHHMLCGGFYVWLIWSQQAASYRGRPNVIIYIYICIHTCTDIIVAAGIPSAELAQARTVLLVTLVHAPMRPSLL